MEFPATIYRLERFRYFGYFSDQQSLLGMLSAPMAAFSFMAVFYTRNKMAYIGKPQQLYCSSSISKRKTRCYYSLYPWVSVDAENGLEGVRIKGLFSIGCRCKLSCWPLLIHVALQFVCGSELDYLSFWLLFFFLFFFFLFLLLWDQQLNCGGMQFTGPWGRNTISGSSAIILYRETRSGFFVVVILERCSLGDPRVLTYQLLRVTFASRAKNPTGSLHVSRIFEQAA